MYLYIAAPWAIREKMPQIALQFTDAGHVLTHEWWEESKSDGSREALRQIALNDLRGVVEADVLVVVNARLSEGKAVEQGIAIQMGKPIIGIWPDDVVQNVFHYLPNYTWVDTIDAAIQALDRCCDFIPCHCKAERIR